MPNTHVRAQKLWRAMLVSRLRDEEVRMKRILVIEDEQVLREELVLLLQNAGYETLSITRFEDVCAQMIAAHANLVLLDINLPGTNGQLLLRDFREVSETPVIMLTSRTSEMDEVLSMSFGADDYVQKPYNPTILLLRISAVLKRSSGSGSNLMQYRGVSFSPVKGSLVRAGQEQILSKNEAIIFQLLLDRQGEIVTRDDLMTALWDNQEFVNDSTLSVNVSRLRTKLKALGLAEAIETRKKQGYVLR